MSKDNGKIKVDPNSFEKMTAKVKPQKKKKDPDAISDNKLIAWFQQYWYYYKTPVLVATVFIAAAAILIFDLATQKKPDMCFTIVSNSVVTEDQVLELATHITDYVVDANEDGEEMISPIAVNLVENPVDDAELAAYSQVLTYLLDEKYVAFIVDEFAYDYMMLDNALQKMSHFGLETEEEYRIKLNDTAFMKDTELNKTGPYYLVFKICSQEYLDDPLVQGYYDMYLELANDILAAS